jgi:hypothetical protein
MIKNCVLILILISNVTFADEVKSDIDAIKDVSSLLENLDKTLGQFPQISCNEKGSRLISHAINVPICSYQDICSAAKKENGFIVVNGIKVPDYQLHTKLTQLKNNILNCYDELDAETESYKDLFSLNSVTSILPDLMPPHRFKKFRQIYSRIDYREQLPRYFEHSISSSDLDSYLRTSDKIEIRDVKRNLITLDDYSLRRLVTLNKFLIDPSDQDSKNKLILELQSNQSKQRLEEYFLYNNGTQRQKLLVDLEDKMNLRGFDFVDTKLFNDIKNRTDVKNKKSLLIKRTEEIKKLMIEKITEIDMPIDQKKYFTDKLEAVKVLFKDPLEELACSGGTPAFANRFNITLCPKALSLTSEAIDGIIGHELAHIIDHCSSHILAHFNKSVNGRMPPRLEDSPFKQLNKCLKDTKTVDIRVRFNPLNPSERETRRACGGASSNIDQTQETFSDLLSVATLDKDLKRMDKASAQRFVVGLAFAKPFKCEENDGFNKSEYDEFINKATVVLGKAGCNNKIESKTYNPNSEHLSMEDRINHIFMTEEIQEKIGCTSINKGEVKYAQKSLECRI